MPCPHLVATVSMLVRDEDSLKMAVKISELAWSMMTAVGSSAGGFAAGWLVIPARFCIDGVSYLISALFIWEIKGRYLAVVGGDGLYDEAFSSPPQLTRLTKE